MSRPRPVHNLGTKPTIHTHFIRLAQCTLLTHTLDILWGNHLFQTFRTHSSDWIKYLKISQIKAARAVKELQVPWLLSTCDLGDLGGMMHTAAAAQLAIGHRRSNSLPSGGCPSRRCGSPGQWTGTWKQRGSVQRGAWWLQGLVCCLQLGVHK